MTDKALRILFTWPGADFAVRDVGVGLREALARQGHEIADYELTLRMNYHAAAMRFGGMDPSPQNLAMITKQASESILVEALYHKADLVLIICGLNLHPFALQQLYQVKDPRFQVAIVLTESPYEDQDQAEFVTAHPDMMVFTTERTSARKYGWHYLRHAYKPDLHRPVDPIPAEACDVLMVGTGWAERQALLEQIDWTGIKLRLIGPWPTLPGDHLLQQFHEDYCITNDCVPPLYASAKICLNVHRQHPDAESLGPRAYELAACGAFQIADPRAELIERFGALVPTFRNAADLEGAIRYWLANDRERIERAEAIRQRVQGETFDVRAAQLIRAIEARPVPRV